MSLVDYASSSEDEDEEDTQAREQLKDESKLQNPNPTPLQNPKLGFLSKDDQIKKSPATPSMEKLPDASFLLNSPIFPSHMVGGGDHSSRVAVAMAESESRKREANRPTASFQRGKVPRGTKPHTTNVPDTVGGLLVPPQVTGRSNVVTEDISKLFVRRHSDPPSH